MTQFKTLLISLLLVLQVLGAGSYFKGPGLIEGFTTVTSAAGTTTLTKDSETKQILTGATTQTFVLPDATTLPLGRYFNMINKSSGIMTIQTSGGGALTTVDPGVQKEIHLRAAGSAAGTWDVLAGGGGGVWGSITGTLSSQTDLQSALDLKAPLASPTFTGTIGTPLTASKLLATDASGNLTATAANSSQATYLDLTSSAQTQLNAKLSTSNYSAKGDIVAGVSSGVVAGLTVGSNGKVLVADSNATAGLRWDNPKRDKNYVTNGNAEGGVTTGWSTYADAAGTQPVDCTGGTPNSTWAASASSTIHDSNNFLATLNTGATRQGEGVSYAFTTDSGDSPAMMSIRFYYKVAGGTFAAGNDTDRTSTGDSDFTVWIYDVTNGTLIQPYTYRLYSNSTGVAEPFVSNFQTNSNSTSYRLCIHKGTSTSVSGTAITVRFDDFEISRSNIALNTPITDWQTYSLTIGGSTSAPTVGTNTSRAIWRRVGDSMEIKYYLSQTGAGSAGSGTYLFPLPSGSTIDTNKATVTTNGSGLGGTALGAATAGNTTSGGTNNATVGTVIAYNSTNLAVQLLATTIGQTLTLGSTNYALSGATILYQFEASVPISGWSSSTQVSDGYDGRQIVSRANGSQSLSNNSETTVDLTTSVINKVGAIDLSANTITVASAGLYRITAKASIGAPAGATFNGYLNLRKNGSTNETLDVRTFTTTGFSGTAYLSGSTILEAVAGDYYDLRVFQQNGSSAAATTDTVFIVEKLSSPQTMSATEVVAASYKMSTAQSLTSSATIKFDTKVVDTHNAFNTTTGVFTAPYSGIYEVSSQLLSVTATAQPDYRLRKNSTDLVRHAMSAVYSTGTSIANNNSVGIQTPMSVQLNAGDTLDIYNTAIGSGTLYGSAIDNWISIKRIK